MIVGLTGGIGSGKSVVTRLFSLFGCVPFDSDEKARQAYFIPEVRTKVVALLGKEAYKSDRELNKKYIGDKIFNDAGMLKSINAIIHPVVIDQFLQFKKENSGKIIIKETALLFEAGLEKHCDVSITVAAPEQLRIKRVVERDGLTEKQVQEKIRAQMPQEEKIQRSTYVLHNNERDSLIRQSLDIYGMLTNKKSR